MEELGEVEWSVADTSIAAIESLGMLEVPVGRGGRMIEVAAAMVTSARPGTTAVVAKLNGQTLEGEILVTSYTAEQTALGKRRYTSPENPGASRVACAGCHQLANGVDHTPSEMASAPDDMLIQVIERGEYPARTIRGRERPPYVLEGVMHMWNLTADERRAIVAYLRSLPPRL
jgi:mono/diheme cytochrome c family protein